MQKYNWCGIDKKLNSIPVDLVMGVVDNMRKWGNKVNRVYKALLTGHVMKYWWIWNKVSSFLYDKNLILH